MVSSADDRLELKLLNKQDNIPRNEIKKKVDAIVQKQPSDVQVVVFLLKRKFKVSFEMIAS